ncbi:MAG TPA: monovalent cation:proton antiporter-2 (CPA2) family protein [Rickettsiales bacterium]|nr:monovalent cation:proton antiporter-2 (CPA2) family protein [Rickettsiales bacterium]
MPPETEHLPIVIILLAAAVLAVSLFRKLRISPVLGYLAAGCIIGPGGIRIIPDIEGTSAIAELGVVFLLFMIGLELSWERLKTISKQAFLLGALQIVVTTSVIALALNLWGLKTETAIIIGSGLAMSSTAMVMQLLTEYNRKASQLGRVALAVLLVQDLAVVPLLVLVPALAQGHSSVTLELLIVAAKAAVALAAIFVLGRILLRPLYRLIASLDHGEIFTALTLLVVLGTGWLTYRAGLSLALGAFIAGLLMAETEYRHQVEADVMPYKGLLLGLFFMSVGMSADLEIIWKHLPFILGAAIALIAVKALLIMGASRLLGFGTATSIQAGCLLAQGGEFSFILFRIAAETKFMTSATAEILTLIVITSMALTPLSAWIGKLLSSKAERQRKRKAEDATSEMADIRDHVVILGFGRVGQTIAKLLSAENINYIAIDMQISTVAKAKKIGLPVYYGDGSRREVLQAIGAERASAAIVTYKSAAFAEKAVHGIRSVNARLPIIARAVDVNAIVSLEAAGANVAISEMFETSLQLGGALLKSIGISEQEISRIVTIFRDRDYALAQGAIDVNVANTQTPYNKMLAFQNAVISGAPVKEE